MKPAVPQRRRAFTLAEVLAAMVFLAILVPAIVGALSLSTRAATVAERSTLATHLAENKLNELVLDDLWQSGDNRGEFGQEYPGYTWELTTADSLEAPGMTALTMIVTYEVQGQPHTVELTTLATTEASSST